MRLVQVSIRRSSEVLGSVLKHAPSGNCAVAVVTPTRNKPNSNAPRTANPLPGILDKTHIPTSYHRSMWIDGALVGCDQRCFPQGAPCRLEPQSRPIENPHRVILSTVSARRTVPGLKLA